MSLHVEDPMSLNLTGADAAKPMRLLVIGGGAIVTESHLPAMQQLGLCETAAVVELSGTNLSRVRAIDPNIRLLEGDFRQVLSDPALSGQFDAALVTLPNAFHADAIRLAFDLGLDVLCEKPLANDRASCEQLIALATQKGRKLAVAMVRRYVPAFAIVKDALRRGLLGAVHSVEVEHGGRFAWPADSGSYFRPENGGLMLNMGVHYLDQFEELFGCLHAVSHWDDADGGVECNGELVVHSEQGTRIRLRLSYTHKLKNEVVISGELGTLRYGVDQFDSVDWQANAALSKAHLTANRPFNSGPWRATFESCFIEQLYDFQRAVRGFQPVLVDGQRALRSAQLIESCYALKNARTFPLRRTASALRPVLAPAKTLITGATGFVGGKLLERLAELGFRELVTPLRSFMSAANVGRFPSNFQRIDLTQIEALKAQMSGCRYVFHLAYNTDGESGAAFTVQSTRAVVDAAIASGVARLVIVSTGSVFGTPAGRIDESAPYAPSLGKYGRSKAEAERYALAASQRSGSTKISVICPSAVYGPGGPTFTELPARLAMQGNFCWIDEGRGNANYVYVDNLVDALVLAATQDAAAGQRFIVSDGVCSWREFLKPLLGERAESIPSHSIAGLQALNHAQAKPNARQLLGALFISNAPFMALASEHAMLGPIKRSLTRMLPGIQKRLQDARAASNRPSFMEPMPSQPIPALWLADLFGDIRTEYLATRARTVLGWTPVIDLPEGQERAVQWLRHIRLNPSCTHW